MAEKVIFSFRNWLDQGTLSGGSWTSYPLANLQNRFFDVPAISDDDAELSTIFTCTWTADVQLRCVALMRHNLSKDATILIQFLDSAGDPVAGGMSVAEDVFNGTTWTDQEILELPSIYTYVAAAAVTCRACRVTISDTTNPDGKISIGRAFMGLDDFQPSTNYVYGASLGLEDLTPTELTPGGTLFAGQITKRRVASFSLEYMDELEAKKQALHLATYCGNSRQLLCLMNPDGDYNIYESIFGTLEPQPLIHSAYARHSMSFTVKEAIG